MPVDKRNIFLSGTAEPLAFTSKGTPVSERAIPQRNPAQHAAYLKRRFEEAYSLNQSITPQQVAAIRYKDGAYLEFSGQENCELVIKSLENIRFGIRLLNVRNETEATVDTDITKATIYVPDGKETYFINRLDQYANTMTNSGQPKNKVLINSIEDIQLAFLDSFWVGDKKDMPGDIAV